METLSRGAGALLVSNIKQQQQQQQQQFGLGLGLSERLVSERYTSSSGLVALPLRWHCGRRPGLQARKSRAVASSETSSSTTTTAAEKLDESGSFTLVPSSSSGGVQGGGGSRNEVHVLAAAPEQDNHSRHLDRLVNASILGLAAAYAIAKVLTVDQDYWHGWTIYEIVKYAPLHNWREYEEALKSNPVLAKMMISGVVYSIGDWMAQCYEGKPALEFSRTRMLRSGLVGFCLHGSLSHHYYHLCEALFPFKGWWVVPVKVAFDQTIWSAFWNSVYYVVLGLLRFENPVTIFSELRATFFPLLTAGWKLWPFAHLITYGVIPVEQRLLWVDCVELVWVTILSMYSNEKAEARNLDEGSPKED